MPLETQITRDGEPLSYRWDYVGLSIMYSVAVAEATPQRRINEEYTFGQAVKAGRYMDFTLVPIYYLDWNVPLIKTGRQVLKRDHTFRVGEDRIVSLRAGDVLSAGRVSS